MQEMMPDVEKCSKDIETKKEAFNTNMMESFELVISNIFTHNLKINQTFFLLNKEKFDIIHIHNLHGYYLNFFHLIDFLNNQDDFYTHQVNNQLLIFLLPKTQDL